MENKVNDINLGVVNISDEVVSVISSIAAEEIKGVSEIQPAVGKGFPQIMKGKKNTGKNVKVALSQDSAIIDLHLAVEYGMKIQEVIALVQENVKKTVEAMTGLKVNAVNINVINIYLPKKEKEVSKEN